MTLSKKFTLTRDMCPIHYSTDELPYHVGFVCPLPVGYMAVVEKDCEWLAEKTLETLKNINELAREMKPPFENLVFEYQDRTEEQLREMVAYCKLSEGRLQFRMGQGLTGAWAGENASSGDIYLATRATHYYDFTAYAFRKFFEPNHAFHCHNVDYYWQALLTRELCVRYFNLLQSRLVTDASVEDD